MPTSDEQAFLDAILASPDDDTPRLVFADWLDERGRDDDAARAALIRAQCQMEHLGPRTKAYRERAAQVKAILSEHEAQWVKPLRDSKLVRGYSFRRGFIDGVTMSATTFAQNAEKLFALAPTIRTARFPDASNEVGRLAGCEYLGRLAAVNIRDLCGCGYCPIHDDLRALFESKHTPHLTHLNIAGNRMDAAGVERLAASAALAQVTTLDLSGNPLAAAGVRALAKAERLTHLAALDLSYTSLYDSGAEALADVKNLPALRALTLRSNSIGPGGVKALVAAPLFARLTSLDLSHNPLGADGAKALAEAPETANLEALDVRKCDLLEPEIKLLKARFGKRVTTGPVPRS